MRQILIFAGTTEGRLLAETLSEARIPTVVCVATEYGAQVMNTLFGVTFRQGRMDRQEMETFMRQGEFLAVADATHPFATEVSKNIRESALACGLIYLRLKRNTKIEDGNEKGWQYVSSNEECREILLRTWGNILLTTGSKELAAYCENPSLRERLYVRVLPSEESIALCRKQGLAGRQIIAIQGPFSGEMNLALIRQYQIRHLVTKESGPAGGFEGKAWAAAKQGIPFYVIGNPETEEGLSFEEVCQTLERLTGASIIKERPLCISLIGTGMGNPDTLTAGARKRIDRADVLFGAPRLLAAVNGWQSPKKGQAQYPFYRAEDLLPVLETLLGNKTVEAAVLFSGDTGFYSGCQRLYEQLESWKKMQSREIAINIEPGVSSVSYFAAACGIGWHDAEIISIHGRGTREKWEAEVLSAVRYCRKVFLLVSGAADVRTVGAVLRDHGWGDCRILVGYQLSYQEEQVKEYSPAQCARITEEGLYILVIINEKKEARILGPRRRDDAFIRGKVPMTKEEIRHLVVCKLRLVEEAVVYDIGSGTGSVAVEIAERSEKIQVFAVEEKKEGVELIEKNREQFQLPNLKVFHGRAPECLKELPVPTHCFIGGSGGSLKEILQALHEKNPAMRIVITAVTMETAGQLAELLKTMPVAEEEIVQVQVSRCRRAGEYHLMQAENPVWICAFRFADGT